METSSTERADRITDQLVDGHPELKIVAIQRTPFDPTVPAGPTSPPDTATGGMVPDDVLDQIRHQIEQRWCHEYIPALNGLTPHEAAADPVAREILTRLIDSFDQFPAPSGAVVMRPVQLRNILGLTEGT